MVHQLTAPVKNQFRIEELLLSFIKVDNCKTESYPILNIVSELKSALTAAEARNKY